MITKEKKKKIIYELLEDIKKAKAVYFADFSGLATQKINELREDLKKKEGKAKVAKKTLADIAFERLDWQARLPDGQAGLKEKFLGPMMFNFSFNDPLAVAKSLWQFSKQNKKFKILGGWLENRFLNEKEIIEFAQIPSREIILGRLVGLIASPFQRLVMSLGSNLQKLAITIDAISKKQ